MTYKECICGYNSGYEGCTYNCYKEKDLETKKEPPIPEGTEGL